MTRTVTFSSRTDIGLVRQQNEDNFYVPQPAEAAVEAPQLFAVADGMGGHRGGKMASRLAVDTLVSSYESSTGAPAEERIVKAVQDANLKVFETSATVPEYFGMGTTLTSVVVEGSEAIIGHVGDSRLYHYRAGRLTQVTLDHSLVAQAVREGILTPEQARIHPQRNIITKALGTRSDIEVDTAHVALQPGDLLLLSSDGLHGIVEDDELKELIDAEPRDLEKLGQDLIQSALEHGGSDNVTVVLVRFEGAQASGPQAKEASQEP